jgi:hypothetical protein
MIVKKIQNICFPREFGPFHREIAFFMSLRRRSLNCLWEHFKHFFFSGTFMSLGRRSSSCPKKKFKTFSQGYDGKGAYVAPGSDLSFFFPIE